MQLCFFVSNVHQHNKVLTGTWSSLLRVEKSIRSNQLANIYWWCYLQGALRGILPDHNFGIHWLIHNTKYWEHGSSLGLFLKAHMVVTGSLGYAQNDYSYEHPKDCKRNSISSLTAWAAVYPAAEGDGLQGRPGEWERIPHHKALAVTTVIFGLQIPITPLERVYLYCCNGDPEHLSPSLPLACAKHILE